MILTSFLITFLFHNVLLFGFDEDIAIPIAGTKQDSSNATMTFWTTTDLKNFRFLVKEGYFSELENITRSGELDEQLRSHLVEFLNQLQSNPSEMPTFSNELYPIDFISRTRFLLYSKIGAILSKSVDFHTASFFTTTDLTNLEFVFYSSVNGTLRNRIFKEFAREYLNSSVELSVNFLDMLNQLNSTLFPYLYPFHLPSISILVYPIEFMNGLRMLCYNELTFNNTANESNYAAIGIEHVFNLIVIFSHENNTAFSTSLQEFANSTLPYDFQKREITSLLNQLVAYPKNFPSVIIYRYPFSFVTDFNAKISEKLEQLKKEIPTVVSEVESFKKMLHMF